MTVRPVLDGHSDVAAFQLVSHGHVVFYDSVYPIQIPKQIEVVEMTQPTTIPAKKAIPIWNWNGL